MSRAWTRCLLLGALLCAALPARAIEVQFAQPNFTAAGPGSRGQMFVANSGDRMVALQIHVAHRRHAPNGDETNEPTQGLFQVVPKQLLLPPKSEKLVTLVWTGPARVERERAFRVVLEQLPIDLETIEVRNEAGHQSTLKVLTRVRKSLYVTPPGAAPSLAIEAARPAESSSGGEPRLSLLVANRGTAHQLVDELRVTLRATEEGGIPVGPKLELDLKAEEMGGRFNLLAGERREVSVPWPGSLRTGPIEARLE